MACMACNHPVLAFQRILGVLVMIESRRLEGVIRMAIPALLAQPAGVGVLGEVATVTVIRQLILITPRLVTAGAGCIRMRTQQRKARLLLMIEPG